MDKILKTYYVDFNKIKITRFVDDMASIAIKMHPNRCFDTALKAQTSLRNHYKKLRDEAQENVKKAYLVVPIKE